MSRNLERRVEACFPIEETADRDRILKELDLYLKDGTAWELTPDGTYVRSKRRGQPAQQALLSRYVR
jgi:polyphosphate kinase